MTIKLMHRDGPKERRAFAQTLREFVARNAMTQARAAKHFGVSEKTIIGWLSGIGMPHRFIKERVFSEIGISDLRELAEKLEKEAA